MNGIKSVVLILLVGVVMGTNCTKLELEFTDWELVVPNMNFPEGPAWNNVDTLIASNCYGGFLTRVVNGNVDTFLTSNDATFSKTNGLMFNTDGDLFACEFEVGAILQIKPDGQVLPYVTGYKSERFHRPNDLAFDKKGNLYFTDPKSYGHDKLDGRLFFVDGKTQEVKIAKAELAFPNGLAFSPKDNKLYLCESAKNRIVRFDVKNPGELGEIEPFVDLPGGDPDGIAFDVKGNLYAAHFGSGTVFVISKEGKILHKIKTPGKKPTNLEFAGEDMKDLYLTEAETNALYKLRTNIAGQPLLK